MDSVQVVYSRSNTLSSAAIRAGSWWGPWSHCGIVIGDQVCEALAWRGVVLTPIQEFNDRVSKLEFVSFSVPDAPAGYEWAFSTVGAKYDWLGVFAIPARQRQWNRSGRLYCSEHVETFLSVCGLKRWRHGLHGIHPSQSYFNRGH